MLVAAQAFLSWGERGLLSSCGCAGFPLVVASLVEEHRLGTGLSSCTSWAPEHRLDSCGTWA